MIETMKRHPITELIYYLVAFAGIMTGLPPVFLSMIWVILVISDIPDIGVRATIRSVMSGVSIGVLVVAFNMLVNRRGPTEIFTAFGMRFTLEALLYGVWLALIIMTSLRLFMRMSRCLDDMKIETLVAGHMPKLSLLICMLFRLVPGIKRDAEGFAMIHGRGVRVFGALVSKTLEDGVVKSISMKDRGYGERKRSSFQRRPLSYTDILSVIFLGLCLCLMVYLSVGSMKVRFFPSISIEYSRYYLLVYFAYYAVPLMIRFKEEAGWLLSRRRIMDLNTKEPVKKA